MWRPGLPLIFYRKWLLIVLLLEFFFLRGAWVVRAILCLPMLRSITKSREPSRSSEQGQVLKRKDLLKLIFRVVLTSPLKPGQLFLAPVQVDSNVLWTTLIVGFCELTRRTNTWILQTSEDWPRDSRPTKIRPIVRLRKLTQASPSMSSLCRMPLLLFKPDSL